MTKEKQLYVSPETEALVIRFEGVICGSPLSQFNGNNYTEYFGGGDSDVDDL